MSPERVTGAPASVADDLYAVGVMAYEAVLGRPAFPHDNPIALARAIIDAPPPPLRDAGMDDPELAAVIDRAMAYQPGQRFASARQMRAALSGDRTALITPPPASPTRVLDAPTVASAPTGPVAGRAPARTRTALVAAGVLIAFAVAVSALVMDPFSTTTVPKPISTSTAVPPPVPPPSAAPPPPVSAPTAAPVVPVGQEAAPPPAPAPPPPGIGPANGPGKGHGPGPGAGNGRGKGKGNGK